MFFDQKFIEWVEENPIEGLIKAGQMALAKQKELENQQEWTDPEHELLWDASSFISLVLETNEIATGLRIPDATPELGVNCQELLKYIEDVIGALKGHATKLKIDSYKNRYNTALKNTFAYEFSQGDLDRVQVLVAEIRNHITENTSLEENHKFRLLKRLEKLQMELHKRVSDLDRFWGMVGDAGVVLGKLGKDAKPIVDRVKEIAEITWKTQARTEELPSGSQNPMLEHDENT
ncbi:MAG: hypothetical protein V7771_01075 [Shewanella psychromarinicola]|uniref:hypothetical protein n=1 Tax=Shewanella psychromarinicola TaxID=2487742 RepID=UPI00300308A6